MENPPPALPNGWRREEFSRPRGLSNGKYQVHYINESGQRFKNKCMLARFMGSEVNLTPFHWRTGKIDPHLKRKVERMIKLKECPDVNRRLRNDHTIKPPSRQTVSNFKLPVTVYRNQPKESQPVVPPANTVMTRQVQNQIKQANNHESQRAALAAAEARANNFKPRQIFWEKRLQGQHASINDENYEKFSLPRNIKPLVPEHINDDSVVRAIVTSLYDRNNSIIVTGQSTPKQDIYKNPAIFLDPYQPPTGYIAVDDNDLKKQEERVLHYRKELERIMKLGMSSNITLSSSSSSSARKKIDNTKIESQSQSQQQNQQQQQQHEQSQPQQQSQTENADDNSLKQESEQLHETKIKTEQQ